MNRLGDEPDLPDDDPDVIAGMEQLARLRAAEKETPELTIASRRYSPNA